MKVFYNRDSFWNYAKNKYIAVELKKCPKCKTDASLVSEYDRSDTHDIIGTGYVTCQNPNCLCRTRIFFTDTNQYLTLGIERAQEKWNSRAYEWFENCENEIY